MNSGHKISLVEKLGYSATDAAANFVFTTMILFQLNFYTDTFGLTASAAAAILFWPRIWDAIFDPLMGVLADRTNTRWGKFRPWILWAAVPWAVVMVLAYTTPKGMGHVRDDRLRRHHEYDVDDDLFDEQHALWSVGRGDDRRSG